jgi:polar amino acid transport system ATP-binding protein
MGLVESGMTMLCVTDAIGFDKTVADRVFFIDADQIIRSSSKIRRTSALSFS